MTPGARVAAAIEVLDDMAAGAAAEQALTRWARRSRFAGSKDRAAVRDHVFDVLRSRNSAAHKGGGRTGRELMIGLLRHHGNDLLALFTGEGHAPAPLTDAEQAFVAPSAEADNDWNLPEWVLASFRDSLGDRAAATAAALQTRAPVTLRINLARTSRSAAQDTIAQEGIKTDVNPLADSALTVTEGARRIRNSAAYADGLIELQDAASQAVVAGLPGGGRVLDYCAGGGGKALALAVDADRQVFAHDIDPARMKDLPVRAARAGAEIVLLDQMGTRQEMPYDLVMCDAPCSGSGAWRRAPEGKWTLTRERLDALIVMQDQILDTAASLVSAHGVLAYATCSVLAEENEARIKAFTARHADWQCISQQRFTVDEFGDGFFTAQLTRV